MFWLPSLLLIVCLGLFVIPLLVICLLSLDVCKILDFGFHQFQHAFSGFNCRYYLYLKQKNFNTLNSNWNAEWARFRLSRNDLWTQPQNYFAKGTFFPPHLRSWRIGKPLDEPLHPATCHLSYNSQIKKLPSYLFVLEPWYAHPRYTTVNGCLTDYHFSSLSWLGSEF